MLRSHSEDELVERALSATDDELARIGRLGGYYAFSEDAMALGGTRALALAATDVLERTGRELRWSRTERERDPDRPGKFADDTATDRALRAHADVKQAPSSSG